MNNYIIIDAGLLEHIFKSESSKLVGKIMKRYEILKSDEDKKSETKELVYEGLRDIRDLLINCSRSKEAVYIEFKKGKEENGQ